MVKNLGFWVKFRGLCQLLPFAFFRMVNVASLQCDLSGLVAFTTSADEPETIVRQDKPFNLQVRVEFSGSGAIALMPLAVNIRVDFFAKAMGSGEPIELGSASLTSEKGQYHYTPTLKLVKSAAKLGFVCEKIYTITAVLRAGAAGEASLINGYIDNLAIEVYAP
jgi:hypothetical protein